MLEAALVSVSSPLNLPITNNFLNRSKRVRTKDPISNKIVKMAMLHKETSKMVAHRMADLKAVAHRMADLKAVAHRMADLKAVVHKVARKMADLKAVVHKVARKEVVLVRCRKKAMVAHKGMVQKMA